MRIEPSQANDARRFLREADDHLAEAHALLEADAPDFPTLLDHSIQALDRTFRAFLTWHSQPIREDTTLGTLGRRATELASAYATSAHLAPKLAELQPSLANKEQLTIEDIEAVRRSYYVARNAQAVTRNALPASVLAQGTSTVG